MLGTCLWYSSTVDKDVIVCIFCHYALCNDILKMQSGVYVLSECVGGYVYIGLLTPNKMWLHSLVT